MNRVNSLAPVEQDDDTFPGVARLAGVVNLGGGKIGLIG
jgi:hypothetical protein